MVFSSFPVYLDHPNLHQFSQSQQPPDHHLQQHQQVITTVDQNGEIQPPPPSMAVGGGGGGIRHGSMVDRARIAKLPLPEAGLKCPRCDSPSTKFCYFNNYSLTQPRHFCKTCRRYWTRGGALRSVPVGGGCRRNKKAKTSKASDQRQPPPAGSNNNHINTGNTSTSPSRGISPDVSGAQFTHEPSSSHQLPFNMAAFQSLSQFGGGGHIGQTTIGGFQVPNMGFNLSGNGNGNDMSGWRMPNIGGMFEPQPSLFPLINQGEGVDHHQQQQQQQQHQQLGSLAATSSGVASDPQDGSLVKREDNLNLTKQFLVNTSSHDHQGNNGQFWGGNIPWTGFSGLNSSNSTSHLL